MYITLIGLVLPVVLWTTTAMHNYCNFSIPKAAMRAAIFSLLAIVPIFLFRLITFLFCLAFA